MTNHWIDFKNADVILVMGANPASNHPISMKWVMRAREKGAKLIVVDPRFTQTAAKADLYAPMRSGTDIAFLGGMIKYILDNKLYFKDYVVNYTNAPFLVNADFKGPVSSTACSRAMTTRHGSTTKRPGATRWARTGSRKRTRRFRARIVRSSS